MRHSSLTFIIHSFVTRISDTAITVSNRLNHAKNSSSNIKFKEFSTNLPGVCQVSLVTGNSGIKMEKILLYDENTIAIYTAV